MTDKELERRIEQALSRSAPNDLDGVLSRCETRKGTVIPMTMKSKNNKVWKNLIAACLALVLVGGGGGLVYQQSFAVASVVSLDVNPSIELNVNKSEKVLTCTALNEEASQVLADMGGGADLKGTKLDVAVNAIVGSLVRHGYLDSISSAILISVEDQDQARAAKLRQELTQTVDAVLQDQSSGANVLSQTVNKDTALEQQAKEYHITTGKAALVNQVLALNDALEFGALAQLSVEELRDLVETKAPGMPIGATAAYQAALQYAGLEEFAPLHWTSDPELDDRPPHYEVEFEGSFGEYEYMVDAYTGEVLRGKADVLNQEKPATSQTTTQPTESQTTTKPTESQATTKPTESQTASDIGQDAAKAAALAHAGFQASRVTGLRAERDMDDSRLEYEVEFWVDGGEYDYTIDATSGSVLKYDVEHERKPASSTTTPTPTPTQPAVSTPVQEPAASTPVAEPTSTSSQTSGDDIGQEAAKATALAHAGLKESEVTRLRVDRNRDDGRLEYEVEFTSGRMEYEYTIDAATGAVLEHESDWDD